MSMIRESDVTTEYCHEALCTAIKKLQQVTICSNDLNEHFAKCLLWELHTVIKLRYKFEQSFFDDLNMEEEIPQEWLCEAQKYNLVQVVKAEKSGFVFMLPPLFNTVNNDIISIARSTNLAIKANNLARFSDRNRNRMWVLTAYCYPSAWDVPDGFPAIGVIEAKAVTNRISTLFFYNDHGENMAHSWKNIVRKGIAKPCVFMVCADSEESAETLLEEATKDMCEGSLPATADSIFMLLERIENQLRCIPPEDNLHNLWLDPQYRNVVAEILQNLSLAEEIYRCTLAKCSGVRTLINRQKMRGCTRGKAREIHYEVTKKVKTAYL